VRTSTPDAEPATISKRQTGVSVAPQRLDHYLGLIWRHHGILRALEGEFGRHDTRGCGATLRRKHRLADILGASVDRPTIMETTVLGATYLAGLPSSLCPDPPEFAGRWALDRRFAMDETNDGDGPTNEPARAGASTAAAAALRLQPGGRKYHLRLQRQVTRIAACLYDAAPAYDLPVVGSHIKMGEQTRIDRERDPSRFARIKQHPAPADESDRNCRVLGAANVELWDIGALVRTYVLHIERHRDA
jgi:hypothetical protein